MERCKFQKFPSLMYYGVKTNYLNQDWNYCFILHFLLCPRLFDDEATKQED